MTRRFPTRIQLRGRPPLPWRTGRNWTKADLFLWESESGLRLAVKDYAHRPAWLRNTLGRFLVRRECAAYRRLSAVEGIPTFAGRIDGHALAMAFIDGKDLSQFHRGEVPSDFFDRLLDLLSCMHGAGVAHCDLHHRDVLMGSGGAPFLVDFSTAMVIDPGAGRIRQALFRAACGSDRRAVLKLKERHAPGTLSAEEGRELENLPAWYRIGKGLRLVISRSGRR